MQGWPDSNRKQRQDSEADELQPKHGDAGRFEDFVLVFDQHHLFDIYIYSWTIASFNTQEPRATWRCTMEPFETAHLLRWVHWNLSFFFLLRDQNLRAHLISWHYMEHWSLSLVILSGSSDHNLIWSDYFLSGWQWRCPSSDLGRSRWLQSLCHRLHHQHSLPGTRWSWSWILRWGSWWWSWWFIMIIMITMMAWWW